MMWNRFLVLVALISLLLGFAYSNNNFFDEDNDETGQDFFRRRNSRVGPIVPQTIGQPWPKPQSTIEFDGYLSLDPSFEFMEDGFSCDILVNGLARYKDILKKSVIGSWDIAGAGEVENVIVKLLKPCEEWPHEDMDEAYEIKINGPGDETRIIISSNSIWGILQALETFSQIVWLNEDNLLQVNSQIILDFPRFKYRSLLLDSSRHFLRVPAILDNLDLMSMNKFNILHWHLTDNEAFPFKSDKFPELSAKGAFHPGTHEYTKSDIQQIIEYARSRGIRVIPEFDTPGHTQSWGPGRPGLLTTCYNNETLEPDGTFGHVDPTNEDNYAFFQEFFSEIFQTFPDKYIHLGGDEVDERCWKSNPTVREFMEAKDFGDDYSLLEDYHMHRLVNLTRDLSNGTKVPIGWQEVWFNNEAADKEQIVHIWILEELYEQIHNVTEAGYKVLLGSCWYLDHISYGVDWHKYYACDPHGFNGTAAQETLVLGGGPNMWGEYVDETNLIPYLWVRASVPAERLWSAREVNDISEAGPRLEEHRCRLLRRGYSASPPNGAGFCL